MKLLTLKKNCCIAVSDISAIISPDQIGKRSTLISRAQEEGYWIDLNDGKATKSIVITKRGDVYACSVGADTLRKRYNIAISQDVGQEI